jgi:hypothetical protein
MPTKFVITSKNESLPKSCSDDAAMLHSLPGLPGRPDVPSAGSVIS